ncbi:hypothetical protein [Helicobacter sp.]|uniref:hypothetical protein n=1 Tax=Helicobacter sp. TaxID=218 RepID=UPI00199B92D4|nr:hypothetical protein [Helicobacter sp.]MBD5164413.1 hypothetical protein [Helicobacter sp.]
MAHLLRIVYPQWQGGDIAGWFDDLSPKEAAQGYVLGAQILALLADSIAPCDTAVVNVATDFALDSVGRRVVQDGIIDKNTLLQQTKNALAILVERKPVRILTLGGDCTAKGAARGLAFRRGNALCGAPKGVLARIPRAKRGERF